jgi:hypothetical protein
MKKAMALPRLVMRIAGYFSAYGERMHCLRVCGENIGLAMEGEHGGKEGSRQGGLRKRRREIGEAEIKRAAIFWARLLPNFRLGSA